MLLYVSYEAACGSVSFPRKRGKAGMGDSQHPTTSTHVMPRPVLIDQHRDNDHRALNH